MRSSRYWRARFDAIEAMRNKEAESVISELEPLFMESQKELERQISVWYNRFAKNNGVSLAEAKRLMHSGQIKEFKWDVEQYIRYVKENTVSGMWSRQLENASARVHISHLESLKIQTQHTVEKLLGNQLDAIDRIIRNQYLDSHYRTFFEIHRGTSTGWNVNLIDERKLDRIIKKPWTLDSMTFSDRIWRDKQRLVNEVHKQLIQGLMNGTSPNVLINNLAKATRNTKYNTARLIMTESSAFSNLAQGDAYREAGIEQFRILETLDSKTCTECAKLDGNVVRIAEYQIGLTVPPFHPFCRGTTTPYFGDNFGERAARDRDGKTYYVPSSMTYTEWFEKFVQQN